MNKKNIALAIESIKRLHKKDLLTNRHVYKTGMQYCLCGWIVKELIGDQDEGLDASSYDDTSQWSMALDKALGNHCTKWGDATKKVLGSFDDNGPADMTYNLIDFHGRFADGDTDIRGLKKEAIKYLRSLL